MKSFCITNIKFIITLSVLFGCLSAQSERWVYTYNGPGNAWDQAYQLVYGDDDNLYAAGYSSDSSTAWDFTVISLTNSGTERWVYTYNGSANSDDVAFSVVYGADSNIYAAGYCNETATAMDLVVISLTRSGTFRWIYQYNGSANQNDRASSIIYGTDGNLYVSGRSIDNTSDDITVVSLDTAGGERWVYTYNGSGNGSDYANDLIYGYDGCIYLAGWSYETGHLSDFAIISLTSTGAERWVYTYNGPGNDNDHAFSLVYGLDNNIYSSGYSTGIGTFYDFTVVSLDTAGVERWTYRYVGPVVDWDIAQDIVYGPNGHIYASGLTCDTNYDHATVISLSDSGIVDWAYRTDVFPGFSHNYDIVHGDDGNIYTTCEAWMGSNIDLGVICLSDTGNQNWVYTYNGSDNGDDCGSSIDYGTDGNLYIAGFSVELNSQRDFTVVSLDPHHSINESGTVKYYADNVELVPNPARTKCNIKYKLTNKATICISLFDISGRLIKNIADAPQSSGLHCNEIDLSNLSDGVYFIRFDADDQIQTQKLVVTK